MYIFSVNKLQIHYIFPHLHMLVQSLINILKPYITHEKKEEKYYAVTVPSKKKQQHSVYTVLNIMSFI